MDDESLKFLPSNSSSPFLRRHLSDSKVLQGQSSLTKDMFEELPNWSKSGYWDVEDVVGKPKAEDGSKSVSNIGNATFELNRPLLNSTIGLSTSKKSLKSNSTFEIEKPLDVSQRKKSRKKWSILDENERSSSLRSLRESLANISKSPSFLNREIGYTRFGFQVDQRNVAAKREQIKAVANKIRPDNVLPRQRFKEELKGVRSNKRFELLMKMRQN